MLPHLPLCLLSLAAATTLFTPMAIRHDVAEARYLELGAEFPAVVQVGGLASGVLIGPRFVLTVAHAPEMLQRMRKDAPLHVSIDGRQIEVTRVIVPKARAKQRDQHDIALLELAEPAPKSIRPLALFDAALTPKQQFVLAGWGILANGKDGIELSPAAMRAPTRARRAGYNAVTRIDEERNVVYATFDAPAEAVELEAAPCIGDSGGPLLIRIPGQAEAPSTWQVAGVIAHIDDTDSDRIVGEYGEEFGATAVKPYAKWIAQTIAGAAEKR